MSSQAVQYATCLRVGISSLVLDTLKANRILLIKREKDPFKDLWCFPGGRLEVGESVEGAIIREVYEETGYKVKMYNPYETFNVFSSRGPFKQYIVLSAITYIDGTNPEILGRTHEDRQIIHEFFSLKHRIDGLRHFYDLNANECLPNLHKITNHLLKGLEP